MPLSEFVLELWFLRAKAATAFSAS